MFTLHKKNFLALAVSGLFFPVASLAQNTELAQLAPVFVSATSDFSEDLQRPQSVTVITAAQIQKSGYTSIRDVLSKLGLVNVKSAFDATGSASVDLRGFGENAVSNVVFVVDGVKLNDNELTTARYAGVPLSSIETIEVIRGGASVAYGAGASGGVIRITTKKGGDKPGFSGSYNLSQGSANTQDAGVNFSYSEGPWLLNAYGSESSSNGFRNDSTYKRDAGGLKATWSNDSWRVGLSFTAEGSDAILPGGISPTAFANNSKASNGARDRVKFDRNIFQGFAAYEADDLSAGLRYSQRTHFSAGVFGANSSKSEYRQDQINPYVGVALDSPLGRHQLTFGLDFEDNTNDRDVVFPGFTSKDQITQDSTGFFIEDDWVLNPAWRVNLGSRYERASQQVAAGKKVFSITAHQAGLTHRLNEETEIYARTARSFRLPTGDEAPFGGNDFLTPQTSQEIETGLEKDLAEGKFQARFFQMDVDNEIIFDPVVFNNINLPKLRRRGLETGWRGDLTDQLNFNAAYQYVNSRFRVGRLEGGVVPLVSKHNVRMSLDYDISDVWSTGLNLEAQSKQRAGNTLMNRDSVLKVPGYATADLSLRYAQKSYSVAFQVQNLFDRDYYSTRFGANGIYPESGRAFFISLNGSF